MFRQAVHDALLIGHINCLIQFSFSLEADDEKGRAMMEHYGRTLRAMNAAEKEQSDERWIPWRCLYRQTIKDPKVPSKTAAIKKIADWMIEYGFLNPETNEPYSERTLWDQLTRLH